MAVSQKVGCINAARSVNKARAALKLTDSPVSINSVRAELILPSPPVSISTTRAALIRPEF